MSLSTVFGEGWCDLPKTNLVDSKFGVDSKFTAGNTDWKTVKIFWEFHVFPFLPNPDFPYWWMGMTTEIQGCDNPLIETFKEECS